MQIITFFLKKIINFGIYFNRFVIDSPILLSFPHFYMADPILREAVEGMTPPEKEKHQFFIDVQPVSISVDL